MSAIRLIALGPAPWLQTQAVYHGLAERMDAGAPDTIVLTSPAQPYLCLGYHQERDAVLDRQACERRSLPVVRRRVGGGATYLDANQLFYQCIFHHSHLPAQVSQQYAQLLAAPVAALRSLGVAAELCGDNEIEVSGRRIAGIGGGRIEEAVVVVGNLLFDFDYDTMAAVWRVPSEPFRGLALGALQRSLTTLRHELAQPPTVASAQALLAEHFERTLRRPLVHGELSANEWAAVEMAGRGLISEDWLDLHAGAGEPMTVLKISRSTYVHEMQVDVGVHRISASFWVCGDRIEQAVLRSDPPADWPVAERKLTGVLFSEWKRVLEGSRMLFLSSTAHA